MESHPLEFVLHQVPLVAILGLTECSVLPPLPEDVEKDSPVYRRAMQDHTSFNTKKALLGLLMAKNNASVWDSSDSKLLYKVIPVDKSHVFPKRQIALKTLGSSAMSPLSPMNAQSPMHPDGIISPQWVHRHREMTPSVVVGVYDMWESVESVNRKDPLGVQHISSLERDRDQVLVSEINEKRKQLHDCGLKLGVIIIVKTYHDNDPLVEERLSYIRRASMIDRQHQFTLFVLSDNGNPSDIGEFLEMFQTNLLEISHTYYREHEKRIKRKKGKITVTGKATLPQPASGISSNPKYLSVQAWHVRYDFKLGVFAEFRQDLDGALRYYDAAYSGMINIMHQSQTFGGALAPGGGQLGLAEIVPGSLRWIEARVFLDSLSIKIYKLFVYCKNPVSALIHLHKHFVNCREFPEFAFTTASFDGITKDQSSVSGLGHLSNVSGGGSFQYWAWASTHYRVFGELIETASARTSMVLPFPSPGSASNQTQSILNTVSSTGLNLIAGKATTSLFGPFSSVSPVFTVQNAGYYYVLSGRCAEERWNKYKKAVNAFMPGRTLSRQSIRNHSRASSMDSIPPPTALDVEKTVDHPLNIIELLTKGYEQFKKSKNSRTTLYLASDIARIYEESGKYDMALEFFERISKTYRKELWFSILASVNRWMIKCAHQLGLHSVVIGSIVELLSPKLTPSPGDRQRVLTEIQEILSGKGPAMAPSSSEERVDVKLDMDQMTSFLQCDAQFRAPHAHILENIDFQVTLLAHPRDLPHASRMCIPVSKILVKFSNSQYDFCILPLEHQDDSTVKSEIGLAHTMNLIQCQDATQMAVSSEGGQVYWVKHAPINLITGTSKTFQCVLNVSENQELRIMSVSVILETAATRLELVFKIQERPILHYKRQWLSIAAGETIPRFIELPHFGEPSCTRVDQRELKALPEFIFLSPAYLDEYLPVTLRVTNQESESIHLFASCQISCGIEPGGALDSFSQMALKKTDFETCTDGGASLKEDGAMSPDGHLSTLQIDLGQVEPNATAESVFYVRVQSKPGSRMILTTLYGYFLSAPLTLPVVSGTTMLDLTDTRLLSKLCSKSDPHISFETPFDASTDLMQVASNALPTNSSTSILSDGLSLDLDCRRSYEWALTAAVRMLGKWDVEVDKVSLNINDSQNSSMAIVKVQEVPLPISSRDWPQNHIQNYIFQITTSVDSLASTTKVDIGELFIRWRRSKPSPGDWVCTKLDIPRPELAPESIRINVTIPGNLKVGTPFKMHYTVQNTTLHLAELVSYIESSEYFVFAGYKQINFSLSPLSSHILTFQLVPLTSGRCALPHLKTMKRTDATMLYPMVTSNSASSGVQELANLPSTVTRERLFPVLADTPHMHGSKHGELYVFVLPTVGW
ncbi:hypothetical protein BASA81_016477 [Batrachochytrium salamandrivorans]|nr:hypothetical protein BASA81_016477 [Batrachochytrium salamandrivorans]